MVGTLISTSGKKEGSICSARRSLTNTNPLALPPIDPEPIFVQRKVPSQNLRSKTGNSATRDLTLLIGTSYCILVNVTGSKRDAGVMRLYVRLDDGPYTQPRS